MPIGEARTIGCPSSPSRSEPESDLHRLRRLVEPKIGPFRPAAWARARFAARNRSHFFGGNVIGYSTSTSPLRGFGNSSFLITPAMHDSTFGFMPDAVERATPPLLSIVNVA